MLGYIGTQEIVILVVLFTLIFAAKRLPEMGQSLGRGMLRLSGTSDLRPIATGCNHGAP
jgi:Sec-independent protein translocase protein TatA